MLLFSLLSGNGDICKLVNNSHPITEHEEQSYYPGGLNIFLGTRSVIVEISVLLGCGKI
jgi:hypothetical protein